MSLTKDPNESAEQFIWRVCSLKESGSLFLSWEDVAEVLNRGIFGDDTASYLGECKYRKDFQCAKRYLDAGVFDDMRDESHIRTLKEEKDEIRKEKQKLYDQRREYNKLLASDARAEHLTEELLKVAKDMKTEAPLLSNIYCSSADSQKEALLCLSDWHYGLVTDNIWNKYDTQICRDRIAALAKYAEKYILSNRVSVLHVVMLGDAAHGAIHTSCRIKSEEDTCDQLMHVAEILAELINRLSGCVRSLKFYSCYGNHMRTVQNKNDSVHSDNMEKIIPWWIKQRLSDNPRVEVIESEFKEFTKLSILGKNICCVHGDLDNFRDLGVTVNTIFTKLYGETIDYTISGDKHHLEELERFGIESILVRSLCGTDDYANEKRLYGNAGQTLIIFNNDYGREATYHIPLK